MDDGLVDAQVADDTGHMGKACQLGGQLPPLFGHDLIPALGVGPDNGWDHRVTLLHTVRRVLHGLVVPDAVGVIREGVQLGQGNANDSLIRSDRRSCTAFTLFF